MHYLVADIARTITLYPGDVLLSGTPANSRPVQPGDVVEVEVEGLGRLTNHIVTGPTPIRTDVGAQPTESRGGRCPPRSAATGSSAASARRSDDAPATVCRSRRTGRVALMSDSSEKPPRQAPQAGGLRDRP